MKRLFLALLLFFSLSSIANALTCPNKPISATTLATVHFNTPDGEGQLWEIYPNAATITTVAGSEGNVSASILSPGADTGGQQTIWPKAQNAQPNEGRAILQDGK
jgi:hypothetical protein